jgi:hypothetical protein
MRMNGSDFHDSPVSSTHMMVEIVCVRKCLCEGAWSDMFWIFEDNLIDFDDSAIMLQHKLEIVWGKSYQISPDSPIMKYSHP